MIKNFQEEFRLKKLLIKNKRQANKQRTKKMKSSNCQGTFPKRVFHISSMMIRKTSPKSLKRQKIVKVQLNIWIL
jgi:3-phenylpropionate/cinnamic acid dioxygenase small subunit